MAEFQKVIEQWKRRCEHCEKNENVKCGIDGHVCGGFCKMSKYINPEFIERDVMSWAAEHPEPVYPTWGEWFAEMGLFHGAPWTHVDVNDLVGLLIKHIPADIAQKLKLKPREG